MLAKLIVKCDVKDDSEAVEIEKIVATAVAHYLNLNGHPGNATAIHLSFHAVDQVAGPQPCQSQS